MSCAENLEKKNKETISKIAENFGLNIDEVQYELSQSADNIMSNIYYVCMKFRNKTTGENEELSALIKRPVQIEAFKKMMNGDIQFHNEVLFYQKYSEPNDNFAKCFYANDLSPSDTVIALENVNKRGYYSCPHKYNAPLEYTLAAMREMGRFHGKGYVMKEQQKERFFTIVNQIQEARYYATNPFKDFINIVSPRAVEYLRNHDYDKMFCDKMEALLSDAFDKVMMKTKEPREPLSTLCHGDFTLYNTLFKMQDNGQYRAMLIDFAFVTYSTPVIDLSTYLCLSCSNETIKNNFSEIMRAYHDALKEYLLEADMQDIDRYSYDIILDDFKKGALFGFVVASHFLPILMNYDFADVEEFVKIGFIKGGMINKQFGGDEMSKILADMLLQLRKLGCLT